MLAKRFKYCVHAIIDGGRLCKRRYERRELVRTSLIEEDRGALLRQEGVEATVSAGPEHEKGLGHKDGGAHVSISQLLSPLYQLSSLSAFSLLFC